MAYGQVCSVKTCCTLVPLGLGRTLPSPGHSAALSAWSQRSSGDLEVKQSQTRRLQRPAAGLEPRLTQSARHKAFIKLPCLLPFALVNRWPPVSVRAQF